MTDLDTTQFGLIVDWLLDNLPNIVEFEVSEGWDDTGNDAVMIGKTTIVQDWQALGARTRNEDTVTDIVIYSSIEGAPPETFGSGPSHAPTRSAASSAPTSPPSASAASAPIRRFVPSSGFPASRPMGATGSCTSSWRRSTPGSEGAHMKIRYIGPHDEVEIASPDGVAGTTPDNQPTNVCAFGDVIVVSDELGASLVEQLFWEEVAPKSSKKSTGSEENT